MVQLFLGSGDDNADEVIDVYLECILETVVDVRHRWECIIGLSPTRILLKFVVGDVRRCDVPCRFCSHAEIRR